MSIQSLRPCSIPKVVPLNLSHVFTKGSSSYCLKVITICLRLQTVSVEQNLSMNEAFKLNQVLKFPGGHLNIQSKAFPARELGKTLTLIILTFA